MTQLKSLLIRFWLPLTGVLFATVTFLSLYPLPALPAIPGNDKTAHFLAYAAFAFPVSFAKPKNYLLYLLLIISWSGIMELIQPYVNRYGEILDLAANSIGVFIGYVLARLLYRIF